MARKRHRNRRRPVHTLPGRQEPGTSPGTLSRRPEARPTEITVNAYGPGSLVTEDTGDPERIRDLRRDHEVTWVHVRGLQDVQSVARIGELFGVHPLILEDVINGGQRAKFEDYESHAYAVTWLLLQDPGLHREQFNLVLGDGFVLSMQDSPREVLHPVRKRLSMPDSRMRRSGADYLAYAVLDTVVDHYFPVLEAFGDRIQGLERRALVDPDRQTALEIHDLRTDLLAIRRAVWPLRDALRSMLMHEGGLLTRETTTFLRDSYDHTIQAADVVETLRDMAAGLREAHQATVGNHMNEVMKVLTIIATVFIPMSFVAGVYGMNFDPEVSPFNMPETRWYWGYPAALVLMAVVGVGLLLYFRRKGWLGAFQIGRPPPEESDDKV